MLPKQRFALNRILAPRSTLTEFIHLASSLEIPKIELRNDLPGVGVIDSFSPLEVKKLCQDAGISILTINAVQKFNLRSYRIAVMEELKHLLDLCHTIGCSALVLCPNNDPSDTRKPSQIRNETVEALQGMGPLFAESGIMGLVEPLGFQISSLSSAREALEMIQESGFSCYKLLLDTFHHHLGPDALEDIGARIPVEQIGLVHVSGVEDPLAVEDLQDQHRVLPGPADKLNSKRQVQRLVENGYGGDISFEPFSRRVQNLPLKDLKEQIRKSMEYLAG
ncbi:MAG: TIM barrel protein [Spirochaetales bacterium]